MDYKLNKIFNKAKYEPGKDLTEHIYNAITRYEKRVARVKLFLFSIVGVISLVALVPAFRGLMNDFGRSGFYEYFSLAFSSGGILSASWKDFIYSLAESLPVLSFVFSLGLIFIFFLSLRYIIKQIMKFIPLNSHSGKNELSLSF